MFRHEQFVEFVIAPALKAVGLYSEAAEQLLLGTCCVESYLGTYLHQIRGPALGVYQMEPATHLDLWESYLKYRPELAKRVLLLIPPDHWDGIDNCPAHDLLITDLRYATVMARILYRRSPEPLPAPGLWTQAAGVWKRVYNTNLGAGTVFKFMDSLVACKVISSSNHVPLPTTET